MGIAVYRYKYHCQSSANDGDIKRTSELKASRFVIEQ